MAQHRHDENIAELKNHFDTVIDWVDSVFDYTGSEMCGLDWGRLYREYHKKSYSKSHITERVNALLDDEQVSDKKGIFEFVLGGEINYQMLNVRVFDKKTIKTVYRKQTELAKKKIYRIVHFAPSDMMQTPSESIKKPRWMPTT